jgi:hypothetical protein
MKHLRQYRNGSESASREAAQTRTLIADLDRIVQILNCDIVAEEKCARISDHSDSNPMPARMLIARRDNLRETIAALELRLRADQRVSVPADPA